MSFGTEMRSRMSQLNDSVRALRTEIFSKDWPLDEGDVAAVSRISSSNGQSFENISVRNARTESFSCGIRDLISVPKDMNEVRSPFRHGLTYYHVRLSDRRTPLQVASHENLAA